MSNAALLPEQCEVLRQALADAISYRDPPLRCRDCETLDWLCRQCAAGLSQARAYLVLSRELEINIRDRSQLLWLGFGSGRRPSRKTDSTTA